MAATRKQVEELFTAVEAKLPGLGCLLEFDGNRAYLKLDGKTLSPPLTMTPMYQWLTVLLQGVELAQRPLPTAHQCPICGGKLSVFEAVERWTYLCSNCEETGNLTTLQEIARQNGE